MRIGEVGALLPEDIDEKNGCIHVTKTVTQDEIGGYIIGKAAKTDAGYRDILLNDTIRRIIKEQKELNGLIFGLKHGQRLFRSPDDGILKAYPVNREIKRICASAGVEYFTSHALRATFSTRFMEQQPQDFKILSEILGHADTSITLDLYTHVMKEKKEEAMQSLKISM